MSINLTKGSKVNLSKEVGTLSKIIIGLGWNTKRYAGGFDFDLDASCFELGTNGKCPSSNEFIFYNNLQDQYGAVRHTGDDTTGGNSDDGDDEQIIVDLTKLPSTIDKLAFTATIHDAYARQQNFGQVSNAYVRLVDGNTNKEILKYNLGEDFSIETAIVFCEIYRHNGEWKFNAVGSGFQGGLQALCANFGIDAS